MAFVGGHEVVYEMYVFKLYINLVLLAPDHFGQKICIQARDNWRKIELVAARMGHIKFGGVGNIGRKQSWWYMGGKTSDSRKHDDVADINDLFL